MDERHNYNIDPWDRDSYETGSTKPPKSRRGLIAVLLVAVILLGGISGALGILNIHLFRSLKNKESSMSFVSSSPTLSQEPSLPSVPSGSNVSIDLQPVPDSVENIPQSGGLSYQDIYAKTIPSVVSISCHLPGGTVGGTGVVLSADGYIVTNCHVVEDAVSIQVRLSDDRILNAYPVGADAISDLAVLYVEAEDLIPAQFGDSSTLRVGDSVAAIGDPLGVEFRGTMTDGIVSAINRNVTTSGRTMTLIQTNAALNSGNSGGPLINCYGQVVGINTMKISTFVDSAGVEGLGFAIPSTTVKEVVDQLIAQGYVSGRPDLELTGSSVSALDQRFYGLPAGFLVTGLEENGCSARAGIQIGDIILSFNGTTIQNEDQLSSALYGCSAGDTVELILYRYSAKTRYSVQITLSEAEG